MTEEMVKGMHYLKTKDIKDFIDAACAGLITIDETPTRYDIDLDNSLPRGYEQLTMKIENNTLTY